MDTWSPQGVLAAHATCPPPWANEHTNWSAFHDRPCTANQCPTPHTGAHDSVCQQRARYFGTPAAASAEPPPNNTHEREERRADGPRAILKHFPGVGTWPPVVFWRCTTCPPPRTAHRAARGRRQPAGTGFCPPPWANEHQDWLVSHAHAVKREARSALELATPPTGRSRSLLRPQAPAITPIRRS